MIPTHRGLCALTTNLYYLRKAKGAKGRPSSPVRRHILSLHSSSAVRLWLIAGDCHILRGGCRHAGCSQDRRHCLLQNKDTHSVSSAWTPESSSGKAAAASKVHVLIVEFPIPLLRQFVITTKQAEVLPAHVVTYWFPSALAQAKAAKEKSWNATLDGSKRMATRWRPSSKIQS